MEKEPVINNEILEEHIRRSIRWKVYHRLGSNIPRIAMLVSLITTGVSAFLISRILLTFEITEMWIRYAVATILSYPIFILIIFYFSKKLITDHKRIQEIESESGSVEKAAILAAGTTLTADTYFKKKSKDLSLDDFDLSSTDENIVIAFFFLILVPIAIFSGIMLYNAPVFFAELITNLLAMFFFSKKYRQFNYVSTLARTVTMTLKYFVIIAIVLGVGGYYLQRMNPAIITIGDIFFR